VTEGHWARWIRQAGAQPIPLTRLAWREIIYAGPSEGLHHPDGATLESLHDQYPDSTPSEFHDWRVTVWCDGVFPGAVGLAASYDPNRADVPERVVVQGIAAYLDLPGGSGVLAATSTHLAYNTSHAA
jgi:hypothetical protein